MNQSFLIYQTNFLSSLLRNRERRAEKQWEKKGEEERDRHRSCGLGRASSSNHIWSQEETQSSCLRQEGEHRGETGQLIWSWHEPSICERSTLSHSQSLHLVFLLIDASCAVLEDTVLKQKQWGLNIFLNDSSIWYFRGCPSYIPC